jgi:hypothetical protein
MEDEIEIAEELELLESEPEQDSPVDDSFEGMLQGRAAEDIIQPFDPSQIR